MSLLLPAEHRMRRSFDFSAAVRRGRRAGRQRLVVHLRQGSSLEPVLVGFVVSKAVGGSVVRNRVERRLRHLMCERLSQLRPGSHVIVRATPQAALASSGELADDLDAALRRLLGAR